MVRGAPNDSGVYALYAHGRLLCVGAATGRSPADTIRAKLLARLHQQADRAERPTHYKWEICSDPASRVAQYRRGLGAAVRDCDGD
ncbi:MAG TPA: hypothetical protein VM489_13890 [Burkholderiales bacterium]|nr:hypothetical protein [Burkholderiales bacterium]